MAFLVTKGWKLENGNWKLGKINQPMQYPRIFPNFSISQFLNFSIFACSLLLLGCQPTGLTVRGLIDSPQTDPTDEPMDLREGKPVYIWPVASPDGKRIVFVSGRDGNTELYIMNVDGSNPKNLTRNRAEDGNGSYAWSSDGKHIVFSSRRRGNWDIYTVQPDGRHLTRLTASKAQDYNPVWSPIISGGPCGSENRPPMPPDPAQSLTEPEGCFGPWIAFVSNRTGNWEIYRMKSDGTELMQLTQTQADSDAPVWSPDGTRLAYISNREGNWDIYVMTAEGGDVRRLTESLMDEDHPRWSSDGRRIIYESMQEGNWEVYTMRVDGTDKQRLTQTAAAESSPVYSPDMSRIAFASYRDRNPEIYVMNADGSDQKRLTFDPANDICPYWAPDGSKIYFSSNRYKQDEIFSVNVDGSGEVLLSKVGSEVR